MTAIARYNDGRANGASAAFAISAIASTAQTGNRVNGGWQCGTQGRGRAARFRNQVHCTPEAGQPQGADRWRGNLGMRGCGCFQNDASTGTVISFQSAIGRDPNGRGFRLHLHCSRFHEPLPCVLLRCKAALPPRFLNMARLIIGFTCNGARHQDDPGSEIRNRIPAIPRPGRETRPR
jgi:hypothetical protein